MQVEVKALLDGPLSYKRVLTASEDHFSSRVLQENHFLDTSARELYAQGTILRVRLTVNHSATSHAVEAQHASTEPREYTSAKLMLKEHTHVEDGSQVSWTAEEDIPVHTALAILGAPRTIYAQLNSQQTPNRILSRLEKEYPRAHLEALEYVGCFTTLRSAYRFPQCREQANLVMHVDKSVYPFGERFEVEVPNIAVPVQDVAADVATFLASAGAVFEFAEESKFQRFAHGMEASKAKSHMVQEVKVVLAAEEDFNKVVDNLEQNFLSQQQQDNYFYDGFDNELAAQGAFFRLRHVNHHTFYTVLKEHQDVDSGSQVNWTQESELSADVAHRLMQNPSSFLELAESNTTAHALRQRFQMERLRSIGSFSTIRRVYGWPTAQSQPRGLQLRVDQTTYPAGMHYEIEVTNISVPVLDVLSELQAVLSSLGVRYAAATESKLDRFLNGGCIPRQRQ